MNARAICFCKSEIVEIANRNRIALTRPMMIHSLPSYSAMKRRIIPILKIIVAVALLFLLYCKVDPSSVGSKFGVIGWNYVAVFMFLLLINTALSALKWKILLASDGVRVRFLPLMASYWTGSFFNLFLPSTIGGDAYRIASIGASSGKTAKTAASVMTDRITGFLAIAVYGLVFPLFVHDTIPEWNWKLLLLPAAAFCALTALSAALWNQTLIRRAVVLLPEKFRPKITGTLDTILESLRQHGRRPGIVVAIVAISFLFQFAAIAAVYSLGLALGLGIGLLPYCFFVPFISLMEMIPVSIFGIGLRDTGYVWFMLSVGRGKADAAAISIIYVVLTVIYVSAGGVLFLLRKSPR